MVSDLSTTFDTAELNFRRFLTEHGYPPEIVWTSTEDVIVDQSGRYFVRGRGKHSRARCNRKYVIGAGAGLGVQLRAICASEAQTFACVEVPKDVMESQYRMIGPGLKMSCPDRIVHGCTVGDVRWQFLKLRNRECSATLQQI